ncbi:TonB-dependent receptor [Rapidithrix thailandica]|uniref:TonB-dependent receptor n=1 Tax=Rapidithrix thailandica TaxID=413964 RepID=A0AAW9S5F5_9BACT
MKIYNFTILLLLSTLQLLAQSSQIKGKVIDSSGEPGAYLNVYLTQTKIGTTTDPSGSFELRNITSGTYTIAVSGVGYRPSRQTINVQAGQTLTLTLRIEKEDTMLEELVVSATRAPEALDEVPGAITTLSAKELESQLNATSNVNEILAQLVPGLAPSTGTGSNWGQTMRGRGVLVMVDGVPQSTTLRNGQLDIRGLDPNVIERVEVIKGATAIYGNGADGGIINYITKKASGQDFSGRLRLDGMGSLKQTNETLGYGANLMLSGKTGKVDFVSNAGWEHTGVQRDSEGDVLVPTYGVFDTKSYNLFAKAGYNFTPTQRLQATYNYYNSHQDTEYIPVFGRQVADESGYRLEKAYGLKGENPGTTPGTKTTNAILKYSHQKLIGGHTDFSMDVYYQKTDNTFFYANTFEGGGQSRILSKKYGARPLFTTSLPLSAQLKGNLLYGIDYLRDITSQPLTDGRKWVPEIKMHSVAPYAQLKLNLGEALVIKSGLRYENVFLAIDDYNTLPYSPKEDGNFTKSKSVTGGSLNYSSLIFNIGLRLMKDPVFNPYLSFSQAFSLPDLGLTLRNASAASIQDIHLEPVLTNNYELGFSSRLKNFRLEVAGFVNTSELGTGLSLNEAENRFELQRAPQRIFGTELSVDYRFTGYLKAGATYTWVEGLTKVKNTNNYTYIGGDKIAPPKFTTFVSIQPTRQLELLISYLYVGERDRFSTNDQGVYDYGKTSVKEDYHLVNFSASYQVHKSLKVSGTINNILNTDYFPARSQWSSPLGKFIVKGQGINAKMSVFFQF